MTMIVADAKGVANDGWLRVPCAGSALKAMEFAADPTARYMYEGRLASFWPIAEEGLIIGEDIYFDPARFDGILKRHIVCT